MKSSIKGRLSRFSFTCLLLLIAAMRPTASAAPTVDVVVMTGDPAPDGNGSFSALARNPSLNDAGQVAFTANLTNTNGGNIDDSGVFRGDGATLVQIARERQALPDGTGNFGTLPINSHLSINDSGQVAFTTSNLNTTRALAGDETDDSGMFLGDGATLLQLVREGQPWPGGGGFIFSVQAPVLNNAGQVSFWSVISGVNSPERIFRTDGTMLVQIAGDGQDAPDGSGKFRQFSGQPINNAGQVAFVGRITGTSGGESDDIGVFRGDGATVVQIARDGQAAPDGNGRYSPHDSPRLNDLGQAAFFATFRNTMGGTSDDTGILRGDGNSLVNIVRAGQTAPDGNGAFLSFTNLGFGANSPPASLNELGQVAFDARLTSTTGGSSDDSGIFRGDGATLVQVVREGQQAPDGNGHFSHIFSRPALNDAGQLAFRADFTGTSGGNSDNTGIYLFDDSLGLLQVVRTGDAFLGSTITELGFTPPEGLGDEHSGLNRSGVPRVAYFFRLADSREGIAIWTLVPEPASLILLAVSLLSVACRSRYRPMLPA